ncbi:uncharacterized protein LOC124165775 [Ischnura elegans]|uniref:uncharacterized protein LOC124165775 n=1 Tax=Ischnura elegans TaxID=197161 RepID=UPI001ED89E97|nr:uncharacterized protein LOC124165775 [Ischnura elegans]
MICWSDCIDFGWVAVYGPSLYIHMYSFCIIGMCQDLWTNYEATFESTLFVFTVCSLLARWSLWPQSLKRPKKTLFYIYTALTCIFLTNIAHRLIWLPLLDLQAMINTELASWLSTINACLGFGEGRLSQWAEWLPSPPGLSLAAQIWSILLFIWMLDATHKLSAVWHYLERTYKPIAEAVCTELNQKPRPKPRRASRRRQNFCEYADDDFQSSTIIDPAEANPGLPTHPHSDIPWDEDTD